jgi:hypothetical protein
VCTAFIGTNPLLPVYVGELQAPYLGVRSKAWSAAGEPVHRGGRRNGHHRADAVDASPVV